MRLLLAALAVLTSVVLGGAARAAPPQADWAGEGLGLPGVDRLRATLSGDELVSLRQIGGFDLSPDGAWLAFSVRQADLAGNTFRIRWFVAEARPGTTPRVVVVEGGQPIPSYSYGIPQAAVPVEAPRWSPDSARFAFRRMVGNRVELLVAERESGRVRTVADGRALVGPFAWKDDGTLVFRLGLNVEAFQQALEREARSGWLLDGRVPLFTGSVRPTLPDCATSSDPACENRTLSWRNGATTAATAADAAELEGARAAAQKTAGARVLLAASSATGALAWSAVESSGASAASRPFSRVAVNLSGARPCKQAACSGQLMQEIGWARGGRTVWFLRRQSSFRNDRDLPADETAVYEHDPSTGGVNTIVRGDDLLSDCRAHDTVLYCLREAATQPRQIVAINLDSRREQAVIDPNPGLSAKRFPRIRKLQLFGQDEDRGFAHLVYPHKFNPGRRYPLVIVQYRSRGFLAGGTGAMYPVFPLASEGFFVLSVDKPDSSWEGRTQSMADGERRGYEGLRDRRSVFGAIERAIDSVVAEGLVDPDLVSITGLSAGAEIVHYALQRTKRFRSAVASSFAQDLTMVALVPDGQRDRFMNIYGLRSPVPTDPNNPLVQLAWSNKAEALTTPLLVNVGEREALIGFEGYQTLKQARRPVEIRVFPDENHIWYHPGSYAAAYQNTLQWLKFWTFGTEEPRPELQGQYGRWRQMRAALEPKARPGTR